MLYLLVGASSGVLHPAQGCKILVVCYIFSCRTLFGVIGLFDQIVLSLQKKIAKKMIKENIRKTNLSCDFHILSFDFKHCPVTPNNVLSPEK